MKQRNKSKVTLGMSEGGSVWHVVKVDERTGEVDSFCSTASDELDLINGQVEEGEEIRTCSVCYDKGGQEELEGVTIKFRGFQPRAVVDDLDSFKQEHN